IEQLPVRLVRLWQSPEQGAYTAYHIDTRYRMVYFSDAAAFILSRADQQQPDFPAGSGRQTIPDRFFLFELLLADSPVFQQEACMDLFFGYSLLLYSLFYAKHFCSVSIRFF